MEEMTLRVPVTVKAKVTETLKNNILSDLKTRLTMVEQELEQIEVQAKRMLTEQAKIDAQGLIELRQQIEDEKQKRFQFSCYFYLEL